MNAPAQAGLASISLKDPKLFREQCYIDGEWVGGQKSFPVDNPATGALLCGLRPPCRPGALGRIDGAPQSCASGST